MAGCAWNIDLFGSELTDSLAAELNKEPSAECLARVVALAADAADRFCGDRPMACAAGCRHCCVLNVAILLPEGMVIAGWMPDHLPPEELAAVKDRLHSHAAWGRWMDDEERISRVALCPLLDSAGRCIIHPVRPLACRGVASLDSGGCRDAFNPVISDQERTVPADLLRRAAFDAAFSALALALRNNGMEDRSIELGAGVLAFLELPELRDMFNYGRSFPRELWL